MSIQGGAAVVRPGAKAPPNRVVSPYWSSPSRMRDRGVDILPPDVRFAGERPAVTRDQPWTKTEPRHAIDAREKQR